MSTENQPEPTPRTDKIEFPAYNVGGGLVFVVESKEYRQLERELCETNRLKDKIQAELIDERNHRVDIWGALHDAFPGGCGEPEIPCAIAKLADSRDKAERELAQARRELEQADRNILLCAKYALGYGVAEGHEYFEGLRETTNDVLKLARDNEALRAQLAEARKDSERLQAADAALTRALGRSTVVITKAQLAALDEYAANSDDERDTEYSVSRLPAWIDEESGKEQPAGLYLGYEEYPEFGLIGPIDAARARKEER